MKKKCFAVVAHIDAGKTTFCNLLCEFFHNKNNILDNLSVEQKRGITVKLKQFGFVYKGVEYFFIDTPGHIDFFTEVKRSLEVVENIILIIDVKKGIQSQTYTIINLLKNYNNKKLIIIFNKIDMCPDYKEQIKQHLEELKSFNIPFEWVELSAKKKDLNSFLPSLENMYFITTNTNYSGFIFDINFSNFGYYCFIKTHIEIRKNTQLFLENNVEVKVLKIFKRFSTYEEVELLEKDDIGIILVKTDKKFELNVGEFYNKKNYNKDSSKTTSNINLKQERDISIFFNIFPTSNEDHFFYKTIERMCLNDPSITKQQVSHQIFGTGYRMGVSGVLHMEIVVQRMQQEMKCETIITFPTFQYRYYDTKEFIYIENTIQYNNIKMKKNIVFEELFNNFTLSFPLQHSKKVMLFLTQENIKPISIENDNSNFYITIDIPVSNLTSFFYENLKILTSGYFEIKKNYTHWMGTTLKIVSFLLNGEEISELNQLLNENSAQKFVVNILKILSESIPERNFQQKLQAKIDSKIVKSIEIKARRYDVTSICHGGGNKQRKAKLLQQQKIGRSRQKEGFSFSADKNMLKNIYKKVTLS